MPGILLSYSCFCHISFSSSGNVKSRNAATRNFGSNGGEKSPMITTAHSTKGSQQQQRTDDVRAARKQVSIKGNYVF